MWDMAELEVLEAEERVGFPGEAAPSWLSASTAQFAQKSPLFSSCSGKVPKSPCNQVKEMLIHYFPKIFVPEDSPTQTVPEKQIQT